MKSLKGKFCACGNPAVAWIPVGNGEVEEPVCRACLEMGVPSVEDEEEDDLSLIGEDDSYVD